MGMKDLSFLVALHVVPFAGFGGTGGSALWTPPGALMCYPVHVQALGLRRALSLKGE